LAFAFFEQFENNFMGSGAKIGGVAKNAFLYCTSSQNKLQKNLRTAPSGVGLSTLSSVSNLGLCACFGKRLVLDPYMLLFYILFKRG